MVPDVLRRRRWAALRGVLPHRLAGGGTLDGPCVPISTALAESDGRRVIASYRGWSWVFDADVDLGAQSAGKEGAIDERTGTFCCERWRDGVRIRRLERVRGRATQQEGPPGHKREPSLEPFDGDAVLGFGRAWRCDVAALLESGATAWIVGPRSPASVARRELIVRPAPPVPIWIWVAAAVGVMLVRACT